MIDKWHLGGAAEFHPTRHGFDEFFGFTHEGHFFLPPPWRNVTTMLRKKVLPGGGQGRWSSKGLIYSTHMGYDEPDYDANNPIIRRGQLIAETSHLTDAFTREAVNFIHRHADKPFYLQVSYNAVHIPLQGAETYMAMNGDIEDMHRRIFAVMLTHLDASVGQILQAIEAKGLTEETILVFLSDNGGPTRELTSGNAPFRGEKGQMYEGGLRVPMVMMWPGHLTGNRTYDGMTVSVDLFATMASLVSKVPGNLDGVNLMHYLTGEKRGYAHQIFFW